MTFNRSSDSRFFDAARYSLASSLARSPPARLPRQWLRRASAVGITVAKRAITRSSGWLGSKGWLLGLVMLLVSSIPLPTHARQTFTVVGTEAAEILACPRMQCTVLDLIPLNTRVDVTGVPVDGFVPVRFEESAGFVSEFFLYDPARNTSPPQLVEGQAGCQRVALIFNIGSGFEPATAILDTLAREEVPATMFVMGWWAEQFPEVLLEIYELGFPIGSHGHLPPELTGRDNDDVANDLRQANAAIERVIGEPAGPWFTPYAAAIDDRVRSIAAAQGYLSVGWTVRSEDWNPNITADEIYQRVVTNAKDGSIVELHLDASTSTETTAVALPWIIADLRAAGYNFVTIDEMARPCREEIATPAQASPVASPATRR